MNDFMYWTLIEVLTQFILFTIILVDQVGPVFKWLFAEGTRSSQDLCKRTNRDKAKPHEVRNKYPDIFEGN